MLNKLFFLAAIKCDNPSIGIFWMRFDSRSCTESFKSIQVSYVLFLLHPFSLYDLRERVNFQRAYLYILLDVIPVFLYNKTERASFLNSSLISRSNSPYLLSANFRKIKPSTGVEYSDDLRSELALNVSAVCHSVDSSFLSCSEVIILLVSRR